MVFNVLDTHTSPLYPVCGVCLCVHTHTYTYVYICTYICIKLLLLPSKGIALLTLNKQVINWETTVLQVSRLHLKSRLYHELAI